jgi:glucose/arabinose dehydrogenase
MTTASSEASTALVWRRHAASIGGTTATARVFPDLYFRGQEIGTGKHSRNRSDHPLTIGWMNNDTMTMNA